MYEGQAPTNIDRELRAGMAALGGKMLPGGMGEIDGPPSQLEVIRHRLGQIVNCARSHGDALLALGDRVMGEEVATATDVLDNQGPQAGALTAIHRELDRLDEQQVRINCAIARLSSLA